MAIAAWGGLLALSLALWPGPARGHDQSAWGGLFRSRDGGGTWVALHAGPFVSGAIALAISPADPHHLLLATDSGVLSSRNGGRDWTVEARDVMAGPAFAVVFDADGSRALVSGSSTIYRSDRGGWHAIRAPAGAAPARALVRGAAPGTVYLACWTGLHRSVDWGMTWTDASGGLPPDAVDAVVVDPAAPEAVHAVVGGRLWTILDRARGERPRPASLSSGRVEAVTNEPGRLWAVVGGQLFRNDHEGAAWRPVGTPLPDPKPVVRRVLVSGPIVLLATDRGLYRSQDGGERWDAQSDNLPAHLEAGPLVRDSGSVSTVYAGFSFTPYAELWRQAAEGRSALARLSATSLAGGAAFLVLLFVLSVAAVRRLSGLSVRVAPGTGTSAAAPTSGRTRAS